MQEKLEVNSLFLKGFDIFNHCLRYITSSINLMEDHGTASVKVVIQCIMTNGHSLMEI